MKHINQKLLFVGFILSMFLYTNLTAQNLINNFSKNDIINISRGINSENEGLRKSSIFFAGKYKISEVTDLLEEELKNEKDPGIRILIALAIYQIGDPKSIESIISLANTEKNPKVKKLYKCIYLEYEKNNFVLTSIK